MNTTTADTGPRIAARFLVGAGHDLIHGNGAVYSVTAVVPDYPIPAEDLAAGAVYPDETLAVFVRVVHGTSPATSPLLAHSLYVLDDVARHEADLVFFYRPDQIVAGGSAY